MFTRLVGITLICSTLLAGCVTTTTKQTCAGPICGPETTTTSTWPDDGSSSSSSSYSEDSDHTGAIITAGAVATAIALTVFFIARRNNDDKESANRSQQHAMTDEDRRLERMYAQAHLSARAGRCDAVTAIGRKLAREQPAEYQRFASDRELARCLALPGPSVSLR